MINSSNKDLNQNLFFSNLKENTQAINFLLENAPMGIAQIDFERYYINVNPKFAHSIGYTVNEVQGMHASDITCPLFLAADAYRCLKLVNREIESFSTMKQYFKKNGEALNVRVDVFGQFSKDSDSLEIIGFYQKSGPFYKKYLPIVHSDLQKLVDTNPSPGLLIINEDGRILFGSRFTANLLGYSEKEISNQSLSEILSLEQAGKLLNSFLWKTPDRFIEYELKFQNRDNHTIHVHSQIFVDDTEYFKNGRMLVIVFKDEPWAISFQQQNRRGRGSIKSYYEDESREALHRSIIKLSEYKLTEREKDVLLLFLERKNTKEIAYDLSLAEITIRKYFTSLYQKFEVSCREDLLLMLFGKHIV